MGVVMWSLEWSTGHWGGQWCLMVKWWLTGYGQSQWVMGVVSWSWRWSAGHGRGQVVVGVVSWWDGNGQLGVASWSCEAELVIGMVEWWEWKWSAGDD